MDIDNTLDCPEEPEEGGNWVRFKGSPVKTTPGDLEIPC